MARLFIFAVGGTGARVLRSFTMLLASGLPGFDSTTEIVPIIIDHDRTCGDKLRAIKALDCYKKINRALYNDGKTYTDNFFMTRVTPLEEVGTADAGVGGELWCLDFGVNAAAAPMKFSQYLGYDTIQASADLQETLGLLEALYDTSDEESPNAELNLNLKVGFKGKPNIGTVVFQEINENKEFQHFLGTCTASDKMFVIGSLFGGTGSSGIPEIVKAIRNSGTSCANVQIGALLMLPYFDLKTCVKTKDGVNTGAIDFSMFNAKTKVALGSYAVGGAASINGLINKVYYVGDETHTACEYNEGSTGQKNPAHVAEFVAAQAIVDFWTSPANNGAYEFGTIDDGTHGSGAFNLLSFYGTTHQRVLNSLGALVIAMRYYCEVICGDRNRVSETAAFYSPSGFDLDGKLTQGVYKEFSEFIGEHDNQIDNEWGFYSWLSELAGNQHKLIPYRVMTETIKDVLSHKIHESGFMRSNPLKDDNINSQMNNKQRNVNPKSDTNFFAVLHDVSKEIYNEVIKK